MKSAGNREPIKMTPQKACKYNPDKENDINSPAGFSKEKTQRERTKERKRLIALSAINYVFPSTNPDHRTRKYS